MGVNMKSSFKKAAAAVVVIIAVIAVVAVKAKKKPEGKSPEPITDPDDEIIE